MNLTTPAPEDEGSTSDLDDRPQLSDYCRPFRRLLVPTDFSLASEYAMVRASAIAEPEATITLLHVVVAGPFAPVTRGPQGGWVLDEAVRETLDAELKRLREECLADRSGVATAIAVARNAAMGILDYATEHDMDVIIMAKRGRSQMRRTLIGSVTEKVVRHTDRAVLTFRTPAGD